MAHLFEMLCHIHQNFSLLRPWHTLGRLQRVSGKRGHGRTGYGAQVGGARPVPQQLLVGVHSVESQVGSPVTWAPANGRNIFGGIQGR